MSEHQHFKLYKPAGYLSQFINNQNKRRNKRLLSELGDFPEGTMAVGRLDENSEGLLFLTTDGKTSNDVLSKSVEKEYYVQVEGEINAAAISALRDGVEIKVKKEDYTTLPVIVFKLETLPELPPSPRAERDEGKTTSWISITLREGKHRQIRKMTAAVGYPTLRLIRVRIGNERLENLSPGEYAEIKEYKL